MTLGFIFQSAISAMAQGTKRADCFSAHVPGEGYVNNGTTEATAAEYRRQLAARAQSEYENMNYARQYAEPGYSDSDKGVLMANWNVFPRNFDRILERAGYAIEWSDEWSICEDCNGAVRTKPDCWAWRPSYRIIDDCSLVCADCAPEPEPEPEPEESGAENE